MLSAAVAAFVSIFVAEFGDKTQLVTLSLACRYSPLQVLAGAMVGLGLVLGLAVGAGGLIAAYIPTAAIAIASGLFFVLMGLYTLFRQEDEEVKEAGGRAGFYQTAALIFLAELGDKTQMTALLLAASLGHPLAVFAGAMLAMLANHALAIFLGARLFSRIDPRWRRLGTAFLFIIIGLAILIMQLAGA
ncbi:MAG: TMEM165/GDT1 family protein [Dethiobacteria bacterium]|jgi:putative Ca2+/H+ antiporter (TMEM165/GDT1 family)|nr:TMEM165/GDT1 family protein [Bacillota bacterium]